MPYQHGEMSTLRMVLFIVLKVMLQQLSAIPATKIFLRFPQQFLVKMLLVLQLKHLRTVLVWRPSHCLSI